MSTMRSNSAESADGFRRAHPSLFVAGVNNSHATVRRNSRPTMMQRVVKTLRSFVQVNRTQATQVSINIRLAYVSCSFI